MRLTSFVCAVALIGSVVSCSDPTLVGGSLLEDDKANVGFSDTLSITATSITNDSIRTYTPFNSSQLATYLLGNLNDPLFGRSSSTIYAQVYPENNNPRFRDSTRIDSIVLVLPYDIDNFYAKAAGETFDIEVFHLCERFRLTLTEVPVEVANSERSTVHVARDTIRLIRDVFRIRSIAHTGGYEIEPDEPTDFVTAN